MQVCQCNLQPKVRSPDSLVAQVFPREKKIPFPQPLPQPQGTVYETYQNCPRLTDKLLEQVGGRRMIERLEIDEMGPGGEQVSFWPGMKM